MRKIKSVKPFEAFCNGCDHYNEQLVYDTAGTPKSTCKMCDWRMLGRRYQIVMTPDKKSYKCVHGRRTELIKSIREIERVHDEIVEELEHGT